MEFQLPDTFESLPSDLKGPSQSCETPTAALQTITTAFQSTEEGFLLTSQYFPVLYSLVSKCGAYSKDLQKSLLDTLLVGLLQLTRCRGEIDEGSVRNALSRLVFLLCEVVRKIPDMDEIRVRETMAAVVGYDLESIWKGRTVDPHFTSLVMTISLALLAKGINPTELVAWLSATATQDQWLTWSLRTTQLLFSVKDHPSFLSSLLAIIRDKPQLANTLLTEVLNALERQENEEDNESLRGVAAFVEEVGSRLPRLFAVGLPSLIRLLDCKSYILRNGIVMAVKSYIKYIVKNCDVDSESHTTIEKRSQLFTLLDQRTRDKSAYSRSKVLEALRELVFEDCVPIDIFTSAVSVVKERLSDTSSLVRKNAAKLLSMLICRDKFEGETGYRTFAELTETLEAAKSALVELSEQHAEDLTTEETQAMKGKLDLSISYLGLYLQFLGELGECCSLLFGMLESKYMSDVLIAVETLVVLQAKNVPEAQTAMRRVIPLIWCKDENVRNAVTYGFHGLYTNLHLVPPEACLAQLLCLYREMTPGEHSSLEDLVKELWRKELLTQRHLQMLRDGYVQEGEPGLAFYMRCSVTFHPEFFTGFYDKLSNLALCRVPDCEALREVLAAAAALGPQGDKSEGLLILCFKQLCLPSLSFHPSWFACMQQLIRSAEALSKHALELSRYAVIELAKPLFSPTVSEESLSKCLFVVGEVSLKVLVAADRTKGQFKDHWKPANAQDMELEDISGFHASVLNQHIDSVLNIQEHCIVSRNLIGLFQPLVVRLVPCLAVFKSPLTQQALLLTFAKFLCISQVFCRTHLPLLLSVLEDNTLPATLRGNCVVAFGDLVQRFPLVLENYSDKLFGRLRDADSTVRRKAVLVLTHLVLNDMLKMRGQLVEVVLCLLDGDTKGLTLLFLETFNKKDNAMLFNLIPETLSKLVLMGTLEEAQYTLLVDQVLKYVEKDRQQENLIDKLCLKLLCTGKLEEKLRICYCLRALTVSERCLRKLLDNVSTWQVLLLQSPSAKAQFEEIRTRLSKSWKSDSKSLLEEFESRLQGSIEERIHKQGK